MQILIKRPAPSSWNRSVLRQEKMTFQGGNEIREIQRLKTTRTTEQCGSGELEQKGSFLPIISFHLVAL